MQLVRGISLQHVVERDSCDPFDQAASGSIDCAACIQTAVLVQQALSGRIQGDRVWLHLRCRHATTSVSKHLIKDFNMYRSSYKGRLYIGACIRSLLFGSYHILITYYNWSPYFQPTRTSKQVMTSRLIMGDTWRVQKSRALSVGPQNTKCRKLGSILGNPIWPVISERV